MDPRDSHMQSSGKRSTMKPFAVTTVLLFFLANAIRANSTNQPGEVNLKYILLWTPYKTSPFSYWSLGREDFIKSKCPVTNCYIANSTAVLGGDVTKFDALLFNGRNLKYYKKSQFPKRRSAHQKYVFLNMESSDNQPICDPVFDGFFNWTATYKLNSDVVLSYLLVKNLTGEEIGPRITMTWTDQTPAMAAVNETFARTLENKTKAVAWLVSHCRSRNRREKYAEKLKESLKKYNLTLDISGRCGPKKSSISKLSEYQDLLKSTYYFYLAFENSFTEDYITEKALTPLLHDTAPIVYGGANYTRFLPPGSYLDATKYTTKELAALIAHLVASPAEYQKMFWWRSQYSYHKPNYVCRLCLALNNQTKTGSRAVYKNFRSWWNPGYVRRCRDKSWGS